MTLSLRLSLVLVPVVVVLAIVLFRVTKPMKDNFTLVNMRRWSHVKRPTPPVTTTINVKSADYWTDSSVTVQKGDKYRFEATGKWTDWFITTTADGYKNFIYELFARNPKAPMFSLNGAVGRSKPYFFIGTNKVITMPASGKLSFFANDINHTYWNNKGSISLKITKV